MYMYAPYILWLKSHDKAPGLLSLSRSRSFMHTHCMRWVWPRVGDENAVFLPVGMSFAKAWIRKELEIDWLKIEALWNRDTRSICTIYPKNLTGSVKFFFNSHSLENAATNQVCCSQQSWWNIASISCSIFQWLSTGGSFLCVWGHQWLAERYGCFQKRWVPPTHPF